jgi:hypothetical protein
LNPSDLNDLTPLYDDSAADVPIKHIYDAFDMVSVVTAAAVSAVSPSANTAGENVAAVIKTAINTVNNLYFLSIMP